VEDGEWREASGLLQSSHRVVAPATSRRIWGRSGYRLFLSHKTEVKKNAAELKACLAPFGVSCFVAHEDIHPTKEWQREIENALISMDAFVALMTDKFHDSLWTDQEVGFAVGRGVPIIALKLGRDPYGFIGKFQALSCGWDTAPLEIGKLLIKQPGCWTLTLLPCPPVPVSTKATFFPVCLVTLRRLLKPRRNKSQQHTTKTMSFRVVSASMGQSLAFTAAVWSIISTAQLG